MLKTPFSNDNFNTLQVHLHQLDDEVLATAAEFARQNFEAWLHHHFELTATQSADLDVIDHRTKTEFALDISFAIANRLPIRFKKRTCDEQIANKVVKWLFSAMKIDWGRLARY